LQSVKAPSKPDYTIFTGQSEILVSIREVMPA